MLAKRNAKGPSPPSTPSHPPKQQQQRNQARANQYKRVVVTKTTPITENGANSYTSPSDTNARKQTEAWQKQQDELQLREQERTFSMLWEKPSYPTSSTSSSPALTLASQYRGAQTNMRPNSPGVARRVASDTDTFEGATPLENWLRRQERHERFSWERRVKSRYEEDREVRWERGPW